MRLTAVWVKNIRKPGYYIDDRLGLGLALRVREGANGRINKAWVQRCTLNGERIHLGLGKYPIVSLADARAKALEKAKMVADGLDPRRHRSECITFREASHKAISMFSENWRHQEEKANEWHSSLRRYAESLLDKPIDKIVRADVAGIITPIWNEKRPLARQLFGRIRRIMSWCVSQGYIESHPVTDAVIEGLPKSGWVTEHHRAIPYGDVSEALASARVLRTLDPAVRLAFEFVVLTACRIGEVLKAEWDEIDLDETMWTIPKEHAKTKRPHCVPLSTGALSVLKKARGLNGGRSELIFPGKRAGKVIVNARLWEACQKLGIDASPHGFRSTFRDWCGESEVPRELAEAALAHVVSGVEGAYARSDLLDLRVELMQYWSDYIDGTLPEDWDWKERASGNLDRKPRVSKRKPARPKRKSADSDRRSKTAPLQGALEGFNLSE